MIHPKSPVWALSLFLLACTGCGEEERKVDFKVTVPVKGRVLVDGEPAAGVSVKCVSAAGMDSANPTVSSGATDNDGNFEISTYKTGDGVPIGEYALSFEWYPKTMTKRESPPDKLKNRYKDSKNSPSKFTAKKGEPVDLGTIDLKTK